MLTLFKIFVISVLCVQLAYSLQCYDCYSQDGVCKKREVITCNQQNAMTSKDILSQYFLNVPSTISDNYTCFEINRIEIDLDADTSKYIQVAGCAFATTRPCYLTVSMPPGISVSSQCSSCGKDLCNGREENGNDPASAIAPSLAVLIVGCLSVFLKSLGK